MQENLQVRHGETASSLAQAKSINHSLKPDKGNNE